MSDSRVAGAIDRLPWLADEPSRDAPRTNHGVRNPAWAIGALMAIGGMSFWIGSRHETAPLSNSARPATTVALPEPRIPQPPDVRISPQPQVAPTPQAQVRAAPVPEVRIPVPPKRVAAHSVKAPAPPAHVATQAKTQTTRTAPASTPNAVRPRALTPWSPRVTAGAAGRLVQVGAYGSPVQAKRGWWAMVRAYPAMQRLPAVVVTARNSHGRSFYRFQVGTTSQAHSEVLCQRLEKIQLSCAVVGLPWKHKVER